jgi:hypothetical protein
MAAPASPCCVDVCSGPLDTKVAWVFVVRMKGGPPPVSTPDPAKPCPTLVDTSQAIVYTPHAAQP